MLCVHTVVEANERVFRKNIDAIMENKHRVSKKKVNREQRGICYELCNILQ